MFSAIQPTGWATLDMDLVSIVKKMIDPHV